MKEYKIVGSRDVLKTAGEVEKELNQAVADGWRPILMSAVQPDVKQGVFFHFLIERDKPESAENR